MRAHRTVSTTLTDAQAAFDDGLTLLYAYNPEQARRSFETALAADPSLALAWWGIAMTYGPNINTTYDSGEAKKGHAAIAKASGLVANASPVEVALIDAARKRFANDGPKDDDRSARAYHDAMVLVAARFPADDDVQALTAEAGMDQYPWAYYKDDGAPEPGTEDIVNRLQTVLARDPAHIGAEHFLIHAVEASVHPEIALDAARRLAADRFEPGAEHLIHMPAHTFERVGEYHEAGEANAQAVEAFTTYLGDEASSAHNAYLGHDCLFGVDAFMMSGEYARARDLAQMCAAHDAGAGLLRVVALRFRHWDALTTQGGDGRVRHGHARRSRSRLRGRAQARQGTVGPKRFCDSADRGRGHLRFDRTRTRRREGRSSGADARDRARRTIRAIPSRRSFGIRYVKRSARSNSKRRRRAKPRPRFAWISRRIRITRVRFFGLATALDRIGDAAGADSARKRFQTAWSHADVTLTLEDF